MSTASQRHKHEVEMEGNLVALATLTFTLTGGTFPEGTRVVTVVDGDSTGNLTVSTMTGVGDTPTSLATAVASDIDGLTGFTASAVAGVITIGVEAPNASVSTVSMNFLPNAY